MYSQYGNMNVHGAVCQITHAHTGILAPDWRMRTSEIPQYEQQQWVVQVSQSSQQSHTQLSVFPPFSLN